MGRLSLLVEAKSQATPIERLMFLATDADRSVRTVALANPQLATSPELLKIFRHAHLGETLMPGELEQLAGYGAYGRQVAARHIATPDRVLLRLAKDGDLRSILQGQNYRDAAWFLKQAQDQQDRALLEVLSNAGGVRWSVRRQAAMKLRTLPPSPESPVADNTAAHPEAVNESTPVTPTGTERPLRERLLDRKRPYDLTETESAEIASKPALGRLAARHPHTPARLLEGLALQRPDGPARETLLTCLASQALDESTMRHFALHREWEYRMALAPNPALPPPLLAFLARDADTLVRAASAENPEVAPDTLDALSQDDSVLVRESVAAHPSCAAGVLARLAEDEEWEVALNVARNPSTDSRTLSRLSGSSHPQIREAVAAHLLTEPGVLRKLTQDGRDRVADVARVRLPDLSEEKREEAGGSKRRSVRLALATRSDAPEALLLTLSKDRSSAVRALAGLHPHLDSSARQRLRDDPDPQVRRVARAADSTAEAGELSSLPRFDTRVRLALSRNGSTPAAVLDALSDDTQEAVRTLVVAHPSTPLTGLERRLGELDLRPLIRRHPRYQGQLRQQLHEREMQEATQADVQEETLRALLGSDSPEVRAVLARHVRTPLDLLLLLTADPDPSVRTALLERAAVPEDVQQALVLDTSRDVLAALVTLPELQEKVMLSVVRRPDIGADLLGEMAAHPNITAAVLEVLAQHLALESRLIAARHPLTPGTALSRLAGDPQERVRHEVTAHPHCPPEALHLLAQRREHRHAVALHPATPARTLEFLTYDAGYARAVRLPTNPKVLNMIRDLLLHRSSQRAFPEMALLLAVIHHPNATQRAVRFAGRLNHPEMHAAILAWRTARSDREDQSHG